MFNERDNKKRAQPKRWELFVDNDGVVLWFLARFWFSVSQRDNTLKYLKTRVSLLKQHGLPLIPRKYSLAITVQRTLLLRDDLVHKETQI